MTSAEINHNNNSKLTEDQTCEQNKDKTHYQKELFQNRLKKKYKEIKKIARKKRFTCYNLYDRDIPEIPLSLDYYEFLPDYITNPLEAAKFFSEETSRLSANEKGIDEEIKKRSYAVLYLYERPYQKDPKEEALWFEQMAKTAANLLGIAESHIIKKERSKKSHKSNDEKQSQYEKATSNNDITKATIEGLVLEQGQIFKVNLSSYLDSGLFLDHRNLREEIREKASKKRVLNLFCYTGSFSVYAAEGNASYVESVDLSNTYLNWAKENMKINELFSTAQKQYVFTKADCLQFLKEKALAAKKGNLTEEELYDLIILDPPTFSNSKSASTMDINKDWPQMVKDCLNILNPSGSLYFSTNSEKLKFDIGKIPARTAKGLSFSFQDITERTIPEDFKGKKVHKVWHFTLYKDAFTKKENYQNILQVEQKDKVFL